MWYIEQFYGRRSGLKVSTLDSGAVRVRAPSQELRCVLAQEPFTLTVPLFTQVYKWISRIYCWGITLLWATTPSRGSRNTPNRLLKGSAVS